MAVSAATQEKVDCLPNPWVLATSFEQPRGELIEQPHFSPSCGRDGHPSRPRAFTWASVLE
jgi:hypothetical protein